MIREEILKIITLKPKLAKDVRAELISKGYNEQEARRAIAAMWDEGWLNVDNKQLLIPVKSIK